jgi:N-acetylglutamate synthase-like GNAT family acetyltransferase
MTGLAATPIRAEDLNELADTLLIAGLPTADLGEPGRAFFRFDEDTGLVGFGGLEGEETDRLLRSFVVMPDRRGSGLGSAILTLVEGEARQLGVERLHLLTNTAAPFFRANGYNDADRGSAPKPIAASREFTVLCPASATYLVKAL